MTKRSFPLARAGILMLYFILLAGCWDSDEIEQLAIIMGSGFDLTEDGQIEGIVQIAIPAGVSGGKDNQPGPSPQQPFLTISDNGFSAPEIINRLQQQLSQKFFLGQRAVFVIGDAYARAGIEQALDWFMRSPDSRYSAYVLTAYNMKAKDILTTQYNLEPISSIALKKIMKGGSGYAETMDEFLYSVVNPDKPTLTGAVSLVDEGEAGKFFRIDRIAVYRNKKLIGFLNERQTTMFSLFQGKLKETNMTMQVESKNESLPGTTSIHIFGTDASIHTKIEGNKPHIELKFKAKSRIIENLNSLDLSKDENLRRIEQKFADKIEHALMELVQVAQEQYKVDLFAFAEEVHIQHPYYWKKSKDSWTDIFPTIPVNYQIELNIERIGRNQGNIYTHKNQNRGGNG